MIRFACDHCGAKFKVSDDKGGKTGKCTKCGAVLNIPVQVAPSVDVIGDIRRIPDLPSMPDQEPSSSPAPSPTKPPLPPVSDSDEDAEAEMAAWRESRRIRKLEREKEDENIEGETLSAETWVKLGVGVVVGILTLIWIFAGVSGGSDDASSGGVSKMEDAYNTAAAWVQVNEGVSAWDTASYSPSLVTPSSGDKYRVERDNR